MPTRRSEPADLAVTDVPVTDVATADDTPTRARPRIVTHNAASVDGRLSISPDVLLMFDERWPTFSGSTYGDIQRRLHPDVLLEGSGSFVTAAHEPDPLPLPAETAEVLLTDFLPADVVARAARGWLTVVDSRGRIRWLYKEYPGEQWRGWHVLVLVSAATPLAYLSYLRREQVPYLVVGEERVDLPLAMSTLTRLLGARTVVSTAGGRLNGALLRAGLVDEIEVEVVPIAVGGTTTPALFTAADLAPDDAPRPLRLIEAIPRSGGRVLLRYAVEQGEPRDPGEPGEPDTLLEG